MPKYLETSEKSYEVFHDANDWIPLRYGKFCVCRNDEFEWEEPAYWDQYKFWICRGQLRGKELPFVSSWRYMTKEEFYIMFKLDRPQE